MNPLFYKLSVKLWDGCVQVTFKNQNTLLFFDVDAPFNLRPGLIFIALMTGGSLVCWWFVAPVRRRFPHARNFLEGTTTYRKSVSKPALLVTP
jgi:hypothetical protein